MGKQVNFYMGDHDIEEFVQHVLKNKDVVMLVDRQPSEDASVVDILPENRDTGVYFWNKSISPSPVFHHAEKTKSCWIDNNISEVVEFHRSLEITRSVVPNGRIWIATAYVENDEWVSKSKQFIAWYDSLARWIKKQSVGKRDFYFVMKEAASVFVDHGKEVIFKE